MAIDWNGILVKVVNLGSDSYEKRLHRQIAFAALCFLGLIIFWKVIK